MPLSSRKETARVSFSPPRVPLGPHLGVPLALFALAVGWLVLLHGDLWVADRLYAWEGHAWGLRHAFATQALIHVGGRNLSLLAWLAVAALYAATWRLPRWREWRRPLLYLLIAVALGAGLVSALKHATDMDCPWDIDRYGGLRPYLNLFTPRPHGLPRGMCFPAGHASAGYAWMALYFFFLAARPAWRWHGLAIGLAMGAAFGFSQQLRGAHFLSHDLFAMMICWGVALGSYCMLYPAMHRAPVPTGVRPLADRQGAAA